MQLEVEPSDKTDTLYPFVLTEQQEHLRVRYASLRRGNCAHERLDEASEFPLTTVKMLARWGC